MTVRLLRFALFVACLFAAVPALGASLEGVNIPDQMVVDGTRLRLNGIGLRTVSVFQIDVYVAGLFLEEPSTDAEAIISSPRKKLLVMHFIRDLEADKVRQAWVEAFERTCRAPCRLAPHLVSQFLTSVPDMHKGDVARFQFSPDALHVWINGRDMGVVRDALFQRTVLASFIGPAPTSERLKKGLLGIRN